MVLVFTVLLSILAGCGLFGGGEESEVFDPPYLENYYLNKHEPIMKAGGIDVYKYENAKSYSLSMGGNRYHGGVYRRPR